MHVSKSFFRCLLLIWALSSFLLSPLKGLVVGLNFVELTRGLQLYNKEMLADGRPMAKLFHQDMLAALEEWVLPLLLLVAVLLVSLVGLWMIQKWAGHLFLLVNLVGFPLMLLTIETRPLMLLTNETPLVNNLEDLIATYSTVVMGVILGIVYFSPLFGNEPDKQAVTAEENSHDES